MIKLRMKINKFISLAVLGIFLMSGMVSADIYIMYKCWCYCPDGSVRLVTFHGTYDGVTSSATTGKGCVKACGGVCGGLTDCSDDCVVCCNDYCNSLLDPNSEVGCVDSCESTCKLNETIHGITDIIYYIAGIIAAIMFVISGYKFITSANPEDRTEAKKGFMFVILALIIIVIADPLVNLLIGTNKYSETEITEVTSGSCSSALPVDISDGNCELFYGELVAPNYFLQIRYDGESCLEMLGTKENVAFDPIIASYLFWCENGKGCGASHDPSGDICVWEISTS